MNKQEYSSIILTVLKSYKEELTKLILDVSETIKNEEKGVDTNYLKASIKSHHNKLTELSKTQTTLNLLKNLKFIK
ncbi:MAG: hypothetical protein EOM53_02030 [Alphaproteobacteria bacterium]|nr:hypothetical protein [Alphaproteobacteria bacterium]